MRFLNSLNDFLWSYVIIGFLVGCALYFTIRTKGVQFRLIPDMIRIMLGLDSKPAGKTGPQAAADAPASGKKRLGSFQAFAISLGSRVGTGNLVGVASAICVGGPGAVFWMWVMAVFGAATAFVESTLAQLYKRKTSTGFHGGPAYYMETGLKSRWMGILFSVLIVFSFSLANNILQSNTIVDSLYSTFGWNRMLVAGILTAIVLVIIIGGVRRISNVVSYLVPFMALGYVALALYIFVRYAGRIPESLGIIVRSAFGIRQVGGGMVGAAIMQGVRRGLFSNEAGEGSAPNAAAIAETSHPVKQGLVQALGVFIDTLVICSCTALIIIISGRYDSGADGIILTLNALESLMGPAASFFVTIAILLFAFSTIIANCYYGETNIRFITGKRWVMWIFWAFVAFCIIFGAIGSLTTAWAIIDICMGLLTLCNLVAIARLSRHTFRLLDDYMAQRRNGLDPQFHSSSLPDIQSDIESWD